MDSPIRSFVFRRAMVVVLGVLVIPLLLLAAGPATARTASGTFTVKPGYTLHLTNISLTSDYWDRAFYCVGDNIVTCQSMADNGYAGGVPSTYDISNTGTSAIAYTLGLQEQDAWQEVYFSDHNTYDYTISGVTSVDHAALGYVKGQLQVSINDASGGTFFGQPSVPTLGSGNFNATVDISRTRTK